MSIPDFTILGSAVLLFCLGVLLLVALMPKPQPHVVCTECDEIKQQGDGETQYILCDDCRRAMGRKG